MVRFLRLTPDRRRRLLLSHSEHVEDLSYDAVKRAMVFAQNVAPSVEPDSRFFELCDAWMQCQDRNRRAVVHIAQDLMQIAPGCFLLPASGLTRLRFRHFGAPVWYQGNLDRPSRESLL